MKILQIINSLSGGGAESFVAMLAIAQKQLGHDVRVLNYAGDLDQRGRKLHNDLSLAGVDVVGFGIRNNFRKIIVPPLISYHANMYKPDIVHVHLDQSAIFYFFSTYFTFREIPAIQTIHNTSCADNVPRFLIKIAQNHFVENVACSHAVWAQWPEDLRGKRWRVIENGIAMPHLIDSSERRAMRKKIGLKEGDIALVSIGSMGHKLGTLQKAQDVLIHAISLLDSVLNIRVYLLGDGEQRCKLELMANELGVSDRVVFTGLVTDSYEYICCADLAVMPSRFEGLPIAAIECACSGLPLVVTDIEAFESFDNKATTRVPVDDAECLAWVLKSVLTNIGCWKQKALEMLPLYRKQFDILKVAQCYLDQYDQILVQVN